MASGSEVVRIMISEVEKSVDKAVSVFLDKKFLSLNNHSYRDIIDFTDDDQSLVDDIVEKLLKGDPFFDRGASSRHAILATIIIALEKDKSKVETIHNTFIHFLSS